MAQRHAGRRGWLWGTTMAAVSALLTAPAFGAGFSIFEQGSKAMGMAGAFTAQADDPSAIFHNVAGLGFQWEERAFQVGATYITHGEADYQGAPPFPGSDATGEQKTLSEIPPHFYWTEPLRGGWTFGLGLNAPFGLSVEWDDADRWPGRFISERAALRAIDLSLNLGREIAKDFSFGIGVIGRYSDVELDRRQAAVNPFTNQAAEIAKVGLEGDFSEGFGWQIGILHRYNNSFSWGLTYRSKVEVDYDGDATFTQVPTGHPIFDAIVAMQLPDGAVPVTTSIEFPDSASLGLLFALSPNVRLETDVNWMGWSSFDQLVVEFDDPRVETLVRDEAWDDVFNYRVGLKWMRPGGREWRFGYVFDENPVPDETLGPLLPDSDRNGFTVGLGLGGDRLAADIALMYLPFDEREIESDVDQHDNFYGTYDTTAWLLGVTLGF
ncbi:MAG: OmpP1/FadL family transporter [Thermoanaerobaculia bacterium]